MRRAALLILAALAALLAVSAPAPASERGARIVGGAPTTTAQWPWITFLEVEYSPDTRWSCGGSVIAPRLVLTAAHCVLERGATVRPGMIRGVVGRTDLNAADGVTFGVRRIAVHPDYQRNREFDGGPYDAAVLEVDVDLPAPAIPLATTAEAAYYAPGVVARVAGWGLTAQGGSASDVLLQVDLPIVSDADCARLDEIPQSEAEKMICAGRPEGGIDTCQGDSGGPLVVLAGAETPDPADDRWLLAGTVSWGYECGAPNRPGLYARAATYAAWVAALVAGDPVVWGRATDGRPPKVRPRAATAAAGARVELRYRVSGETGRTRETITIRRRAGGTVLRKLVTKLAVNPAGRDVGVRWKVPVAFDGAYVWCVSSRDEARNESKPACAKLAVTPAG